MTAKESQRIKKLGQNKKKKTSFEIEE